MESLIKTATTNNNRDKYFDCELSTDERYFDFVNIKIDK